MYCRQCGYNLRGLERERCPECGREFRFDDPATYAKKPLWPAWIHGIALLVLMILVPLVILFFVAVAVAMYAFRDGFGP